MRIRQKDEAGRWDRKMIHENFLEGWLKIVIKNDESGVLGWWMRKRVEGVSFMEIMQKDEVEKYDKSIRLKDKAG